MNINYFYAGCISGFSQTIIGHPFDTLKVLQQNNIKKNYNIKTLYNGLSMPLYQTPIICGVGFFVNDSISLLCNNEYISGTISGIICSLFICPFEYYKVNIQSNKNIKINLNSLTYSYKNIGYVVSREAPSTGIYFGIYKECKKHNISSFLSGGVAGVLSWLCTYPLDTIKTRVQTQKYTSMYNAIKMGHLFSGLNYCLMRAFIVNSVGFTTYEYFK